MALNSPYEFSNPYSALQKFVYHKLRDLKINVEIIGDFIKAEIKNNHLDLFEVPNIGMYLLKFQNISIPEEIKKKKFYQIHITSNHPLIKKLSANLNEIGIQGAEFKHENEIEVEKLFDWLKTPFLSIGLSLNSDDKVQIEYEIQALEIWYEIITKAGRGIFPVILKKLRSNFEKKSKKKENSQLYQWIWDEEFQKSHKLRRGELISPKKLEHLYKNNKNQLNLESAKNLSYDKVIEKLKGYKFYDGAFLRRLRQLRMEEIYLEFAQKKRESIETINHHKRRITQFRREIESENEILLNSVVLLYSKVKIEQIFNVTDELNNIVIQIQGIWSSENPNFVNLILPDLKTNMNFPLKAGIPVQSPPAFGICPQCQKLKFEEEIVPVKIGEGSDCPDCRKRCFVCNFSISKEKRTKHSLKKLNAWLCPDHTAKCEISKKIYTPDELTLLNSGLYALPKFTVECEVCKQISKPAESTFHLKKKSKQNYYAQENWLCPKHSKRCELTGFIVSPSEMVELKTGEHVAIQITNECTICKSESQEYTRHLIKEMKAHWKKSDFILCKDHYSICDLSKLIVLPSEIIKIKSGKNIAIHLTNECYVCSQENRKFIRHISDEMKTHSYDKSKILCEKHYSVCELTGLIVLADEIEEIVSGEKIAIQLTEICTECKKKNNPIIRHLRKKIKIHSLNPKIKLCREHRVICDISNKIVTHSEIIEISSGLKVLPEFVEKCSSCEKNSELNPYYLLKNLHSHSNASYKGIYSCNDHSFFCWGCNDYRPVIGVVDPTNFVSILCPQCSKEWNNENINNDEVCMLCNKFSQLRGLFKRLDKCPHCRGKLLRSNNIFLPDLYQKIFNKNLKKIKIYKSKDAKFPLTLIVNGAWYTPWHKNWFLIMNDNIPVATNNPDMLTKSIINESKRIFLLSSDSIQ